MKDSSNGGSSFPSNGGLWCNRNRNAVGALSRWVLLKFLLNLNGGGILKNIKEPERTTKRVFIVMMD